MTQHWRKQASVAYGYSLTRLALHYYGYCEEADETMDQNRVTEAEEQFHRILGACLAGETPLDELKKLREQVFQEMETVIAYADCFQIYEYALNRMERRFDSALPTLDVEEEELVARLVHFLSDAGDAAVMNQRIQMMVAQLPVRLTRQKFYAMVLDALSAYIGSDQSGLDSMMYLLRTNAMVELTREEQERYPDLDCLLEQLQNLPFRQLEAIPYQESVRKITLAGETLYRLSDTWRTLQEMVNDLYVICLTRADAMRDTVEETNALMILKELYAQRESGVYGAIADEVTEHLYLLEGVQESYDEKYQRLGPAPEYQNGEEASAYSARCVDKLLSASSFASLEEDQEVGTVTRSDVEAAANAFFAQLEPVFAANAKPVVRAIMAAVLSNLPVFFNSLDEIERYIANSFGSCTDSAEKETCMELLLKLMEYEDYGMV